MATPSSPSPVLPKFIPITEAVKKSHLSEKALRDLLRTGKIAGGEMNGVIVVDANTLPVRKEDLPEYKKFREYHGVGISINEASRRFNISFTTLRTWVKRGYIKTIQEMPSKTLIDKQDVAYCVAVYKKQGGKGKRVFNEDGTPYKQKPIAI
jgi:hypothetical protein